MDLSDKLVVVTGSSKGIGFETCKIFLENDFKVIGISRGDTNLSDKNFSHYKTDLSGKDNLKSVFSAIQKDHGDIDILVNNAGMGVSAYMHEMKDEDWEKMFDLNVNSIFYSTKSVLPAMMKNGYGHIVNLSSIAGLTGIETMAGYCGTKHAVRGISHSLYKEVRNYGIKVTCIYPGSVNTHFFDNIESVTANENMMRAKDIAKSIFDAVNTHPNYHVVDLEVRPLKPKG